MNAPQRLLKKIGFNGFFVAIDFPTFRQDGRKSELSVIEMVSAFLDQWFGPNEPPFALLIFIEALENAAEHGNRYDPSKMITVGIWVGEMGVLFGVKDEGDFFKREEIKSKIWQRRTIPSSRPTQDGGAGLKMGVYKADHVGIKDGALFFAVLLKDG